MDLYICIYMQIYIVIMNSIFNRESHYLIIASTNTKHLFYQFNQFMNKKLTLKELLEHSKPKQLLLKNIQQEEEEEGPPPLSIFQEPKVQTEQWVGRSYEPFGQGISGIKQQISHNQLKKDLSEQNLSEVQTPKKKKRRNQFQALQMIQNILEKMPKQYHSGNYFENNTTRQILIILLTNVRKQNQFIEYLVSRMPEMPTTVIKNYQLLILLLKKVSNKQYQIKYNKSDFRIIFNHVIQQRKEDEIYSLKKRIQEKQQQLLNYTKSYEKIIGEMSTTIQQLIIQNNQKKSKVVTSQQTLKKRVPTFSRTNSFYQ